MIEAVKATKSELRFLTCGSVDNGKSTLIGRILFNAELLFDDQLSKLITDSQKEGRVPKDELDYSLLVDGLAAEREQSITIDIAWRYFSTKQRGFIVADCPGHEQYTRNTATGASFADLAVLLIDAEKGLSEQSKRHSYICALMGIKHIVLAINKIDKLDYAEAVYKKILQDYKKFTRTSGFLSIYAIPVSALKGDNVTSNSQKTPWYKGQALLPYLETVELSSAVRESSSIALPVQTVLRGNEQRFYAGLLVEGLLRKNEELIVLPSGKLAKINAIYDAGKAVEEASKGHAVSVSLDRELDISRGDVLTSKNNNLEQTDMISARLVWLSEHHLVQGRSFLLKTNVQIFNVSITKLKYEDNIEDGGKVAVNELSLNSIGEVDIKLDKPLVCKTYELNKTLGSFILIDRISNETVALGTILHTLRRSTNIKWHEMQINRELRAVQKSQNPITIWFTGLSGAGKSTLANTLEKKIFQMGYHTMILDGANIRQRLNQDLGFSEADRAENIRRVAELARLMNEAGLIVIASFISPYTEDRRRAREIIGSKNFIEVYINTPLQECENRDTKGLYKKARSGLIPNFTGVNDIYEAPEYPEIKIDTSKLDINQSIELLFEYFLKLVNK